MGIEGRGGEKVEKVSERGAVTLESKESNRKSSMFSLFYFPEGTYLLYISLCLEVLVFFSSS